MNVLSLRQIDAAWRRQDADAPSDSLKPVRGSLPSLFPPGPSIEPTRHVRAKPSAAATDQGMEPPVGAPEPAAKTEVLIWSAVLAVLVALLTVLVVVRLRPSGDQRVLYVEAQPAVQGAAPGAVAPEPRVDPVGEMPAAPSTERDAAHPDTARTPGSRPAARKLDDPGNQLTERFAERRADVSACFQKPGPAPAQLSIAFEVDPHGWVERAELEPQSLSGTELGNCLLGIAHSTQFGTQLGYLRFRIPVNARTHKGP
jgi:hypothetical protein